MPLLCLETLLRRQRIAESAEMLTSLLNTMSLLARFKVLPIILMARKLFKTKSNHKTLKRELVKQVKNLEKVKKSRTQIVRRREVQVDLVDLKRRMSRVCLSSSLQMKNRN